jgi:Pseudouridylate synthases, 23S RNA-specific
VTSGVRSKTGFAKSKSTWGKDASSAEKQARWGARELDIVIQTEDYVIVNKPSGLASQPGSGTRPGESLVEYLWEWGKSEGLDFKPTIAHRLDQETSGMLIAALHGDTLRDFTRMIREHEVEKFYFALVKGNLKKEKGTIDESLTRTDAAKGSKMKVGETGKDAQKAITHYRVKQHYEGYDLRKNQARDRAHAPDPRPLRKHRPPAPGRHPLRRFRAQPRGKENARAAQALLAQLQA